MSCSSGWGASPGHEPETHAFIGERFHASSAIMIDVGAFCGAFSLRYQAQFTSIHLFEASQTNFAALSRNILLNGSNIHGIHAAATDKAEPVRLFLNGGDTNSLIGTGRSEVVEGVRLDDYWDSIGRPAVALIKIDVEGAEAFVLRGASDLLRAGCVIIAEANDADHQHALEQLMSDRGYEVTATLDGRNLIFEPSKPS